MKVFRYTVREGGRWMNWPAYLKVQSCELPPDRGLHPDTPSCIELHGIRVHSLVARVEPVGSRKRWDIINGWNKGHFE